MSNVRATIVELFNRETPVKKDGNKDVIWNGEDNLYPNKIELVVQNSPTGAAAASTLAKFISGSGIILDGQLLQPKEQPKVSKDMSVGRFVATTARTLSVHSGFYWHIRFAFDETLRIKPVSAKLVPYARVRRYKGDDEGNSGRFYVRDFDKRHAGLNKKEGKWYWPFSLNQDVIKAQIAADAEVEVDELQPEHLESYRGQIFYYNATPEFEYALSRFDSVYNDLDLEYRIGLYANTQARLGFLGKTIFIFNGLDEEEQKEKDEEVKQFLGAEESGSAYILHVSTDEDLSKVMRTEQLKPQFDDKLFEQASKRAKTNILSAANNLPYQLVNVGEGAMFGTQSDTYREIKDFYEEQCQDDRNAIQDALNAVFGWDIKIAPLDYVEAN